MTKIKLLSNESHTLKELLHRININNYVYLEIDLEEDETLILNLNINAYEKVNIINNIINSNIINKAIYIDNKENINNSYTLNKININRNILNHYNSLNVVVQTTLSDILHKLGIKTSHLGYTYIKEAITYLYHNNLLTNNMTKIYKQISNKYNTSIASIESSIRRSIEEGFKNASPEIVKTLFGYSLNYNQVCPTNTDFIVTITDHLKTIYKNYN